MGCSLHGLVTVMYDHSTVMRSLSFSQTPLFSIQSRGLMECSLHGLVTVMYDLHAGLINVSYGTLTNEAKGNWGDLSYSYTMTEKMDQNSNLYDVPFKPILSKICISHLMGPGGFSYFSSDVFGQRRHLGCISSPEPLLVCCALETFLARPAYHINKGVILFHINVDST